MIVRIVRIALVSFAAVIRVVRSVAWRVTTLITAAKETTIAPVGEERTAVLVGPNHQLEAMKLSPENGRRSS